MTRTNFLRSVFLPVMTLIVCACSSDEQSVAGAAAPSGDACSMLTAEAISSVLGKPVGAGRKTNEAGGGQDQGHMTACTWEAEAAAPGASAVERMRNSVAVNLILWSWPNARGGASFIESFRNVAKELNTTEPTSIALGDEAILDGTSVHARKGNASFTVAVQAFGDADEQAAGNAAEALAKQVVAKL